MTRNWARASGYAFGVLAATLAVRVEGSPFLLDLAVHAFVGGVVVAFTLLAGDSWELRSSKRNQATDG